MKLFIGNFEFEHLLSPGRKGDLPERLRRLNAEMAPALAVAAEEGDVIWNPEPVDADFPRHLEAIGLPHVEFTNAADQRSHDVELCPWGWTKEVLAWGKRRGWNCPAPEISAVRHVNSRRFSTELDWELGTALPGACRIQTLDELDVAIQRCHVDSRQRGWVVKAEFGMSARERILGQNNVLTDPQRQWAQRRLHNDGMLFFEPWVEKLEEAGIQITVPRDGSPQIDAITPLLTGPHGEYRGSRFATEEDLQSRWSTAITAGLQAACRAQQAGYFGPLGIDAMRYRDGSGNEQIRSLQDINARWTMGRVSLGLRRLLKPGEQGIWLHLPSRSRANPDVPTRETEFLGNLPAGVQIIRTSPLLVGGTPPRYQTFAVIAQSAGSLHRAVERFQDLPSRGK